MTTPVLVIVLLAATSFAIARILQRYAQRFVVLSGAEYLLVGVFLGPMMPWHLIDTNAMALMQPLVSLLLGLIGFLIGLRMPQAQGGGPATTVGLLSAGAVAGMVGGAVVLVADWVGVRPGQAGTEHYRLETLSAWGYRLVFEVSDTQIWLALAIGASATIASPSVVQAARERLGSHGQTGRLLSTLAETSHWVGVGALGVALALARSRGDGPLPGLGLSEWAGLAIMLGAGSGVLFSLFIGPERDAKRVFLAALGGVIFATGAGTALGVSPLFVNLVVGLTVALTSPHAPEVRREIDRLSHPLFVLTMILAGAMWQPVSGLLWLLPVVYVVVRVLARGLFLGLFGSALLSLPPRISQGLLAQGTAAVAIAVDFAQRVPELSALVLSTVLVGALCSELFSHRALSALLQDVSEHRLTTGDGSEAEA